MCFLFGVYMSLMDVSSRGTVAHVFSFIFILNINEDSAAADLRDNDVLFSLIDSEPLS